MREANRTHRGASSRGANGPCKKGRRKHVEKSRPSNQSRISVEDAVKMKDEQLRLIQEQNRALLETINELEEMNMQQRSHVAEVEMRAANVQEENLRLQEQCKNNYEEGRLYAQTSLRRQIDSSQHQLKVMAEQNTELLRLLEVEEKRGTKSLSDLKEMEVKYRGVVEKQSSLVSEFEVEKEEMREAREHLAQRERELTKEVAALREKVKGQVMKLNSTEEKLVRVSNANVELQSSLLEVENTHAERARGLTREEEKQAAATETELMRVQGLLLVETNERKRLDEERNAQAVQLKDMADKTFQLIERIKVSEQKRAPAQRAAEKAARKVTELRTKLTRATEARIESQKKTKSCLKELGAAKRQVATLTHKLEHLTSLNQKEREAREREIKSRKETTEHNKVLSSKLSYLLNKSSIDDENQEAAKQDMKRVEIQLMQLTKDKAVLERQVRDAKNANRVLAEAMQIKQEEMDKLQVRSQMKAMEQEIYHENKSASSEMLEHKRQGSYRIFLQKRRGREPQAYGIEPRKSCSSEANSLLNRTQLNAFFRYVARRPSPKHIEICAEKMAQVLSFMYEDANAHAKQIKRSIALRDRLRSELELLRRKSTLLQERLCAEEEHKRKTLLKYLHAIVSGQVLRSHAGSGTYLQGSRRKQISHDRDQTTETIENAVTKTKESTEDLDHTDASDLKTDERGGEALADDGQKASVLSMGKHVVQLADSGVGDEEIHALVAVINGHDIIANLDIRRNGITDVGARALAALARGSKAIVNIDLRENYVGRSGIRYIAEALEQNKRCSHVYVHGNGKIEGLGPVVEDGAENEEVLSPDGKMKLNHNFATSAVDTIIVIDLRDQKKRSEPTAIKPIEMATEKGPLAQRIRELEQTMGPRIARPRPNIDSAIEEANRVADVWVARAKGSRATFFFHFFIRL